MTKPILTVFLVTYNHEKTIRDTFEGILKQKTKFPFIVKILEDCSTDNTLAICKEYVKKHPKLFQLIAQPVNTNCSHIRWAINECIKTPYFTLIEGDDYWINENHLQKAISFLETHSDYNMWTSNVLFKAPTIEKEAFDLQRKNRDDFGHDISIEHYMYFQTAARVYRHVFDFNKFPDKTIEFDIYLYSVYLDRGKSYCDHEVDAVYRMSESGMWNRLSDQEQRNSLYEIVYISAKLLNFRHAKFLVKQLPERKIRRFRHFIGHKLTLLLYVFLYGLKHRTAKKQKYDLIFSMGAACSCSSALCAAELQVSSYPFDWLFGSDFCGRADIVASEFKRFIDKKDLEYVFSERSIRCDAYHNKYNDLTFNHDFELGMDLSETYPAVREKYDRRIKRLISNIENANRILIVYIETPDSTDTMPNDKIVNAFANVQKHWPDKTIDLVYMLPDNTISGFRKMVLSPHITRFIGNYKSNDDSAVSYAVNERFLKNFLKQRYVLKQPFFTIMKKKMLKIAIQFIPWHRVRVRMRKKYHLE